MGISGPNTAILAPRGSAKSTVLGLFAAWMIGRHTAAKEDDAYLCISLIWLISVVLNQQLSKAF